MGKLFSFGFLAGISLTEAQTAEAEWFLMSRHGECAEVMSVKRKVDDLKPFSDPQGCVRQMRERGLQVETHAHQLEKIKAVEVRVPEKELAVMFVERQACREFLPK